MRYILTDPTGRYLWCAPGMRRLCDGCRGRIPTWDTRSAAQAACNALRDAIGLALRPEAIRARTRK